MQDKPTSYEAARNVMSNKPVMSRAAFDKLIPELKPYAFCITGVEDAQTLQDVRDIIGDYVANPHGQSWQDAKQSIAEKLKALPTFSEKGAQRRAELLLQTHGYEAMRVGQWELAQETKDILPYFKYLCTQDDHTRISHRALHGLVLPVDHKFWDTHMPPGWDWGCRCQVVQIDEFKMRAQREAEKKIPRERRRVLDKKQLELLEKNNELWISPTQKIELVSSKNSSCKSLYMDSEEILKKFDEPTKNALLKNLESIKVDGIDGVNNARDWFEGKHHKVKNVAPSSDKLNFITINKNSDMFKNFGKEIYEQAHSIIETSSEEIKDLWNKCESNINIKSMTFKGVPHYSPFEDAVSFNLKDDVSERRHETPFSTFFHEAGHSIDYVANAKLGQRLLPLSYSYKDNLFGKTLKKEYEAHLKKVAEELKAEYKANKDNLQWYKDKGFLEDGDFEEYKIDWHTGKRPSFSSKWIKKSFNNKHFTEAEIFGGSTNGLQDIISGCSDGKHIISWHHKATYWKRAKDAVPAEAFAEMMNASIQNAKTGEMDKIRKMFPDSTKVFYEIINKIRSM